MRDGAIGPEKQRVGNVIFSAWHCRHAVDT